LGSGEESHGNEFVGDFFDFEGLLVGDALGKRRSRGRKREKEMGRGRTVWKKS